MNVDDVANTTRYPEDLLADIVRQQTELMAKYTPIEKANGFHERATVPADLDDRFGQAKLKDFAWRVTEELAEATEAMVKHSTIPQHAKEELGDALHFLIELDILSGIDFDEHIAPRDMFPSTLMPVPDCGLERLFVLLKPAVPDRVDIVRGYAYLVVEELGKAMNCLKQKPWKQTHILTDKAKYRTHLIQANVHFFATAFLLMDPKELYDVYCRKKQVNEFRIRSQY